jgi:hypothetical protein
MRDPTSSACYWLASDPRSTAALRHAIIEGASDFVPEDTLWSCCIVHFWIHRTCEMDCVVGVGLGKPIDALIC